MSLEFRSSLRVYNISPIMSGGTLGENYIKIFNTIPEGSADTLSGESTNQRPGLPAVAPLFGYAPPPHQESSSRRICRPETRILESVAENSDCNIPFWSKSKFSFVYPHPKEIRSFELFVACFYISRENLQRVWGVGEKMPKAAATPRAALVSPFRRKTVRLVGDSGRNCRQIGRQFLQSISEAFGSSKSP